MATVTDTILEEIKARIELSELIQSYGIAVKAAGASKVACCPFHNEKTPSFNINDSKGFYHCFGCGESGDAIKFVQKMDGASFIEAVKKLARQSGVKIEEREDPMAGKRKRLLALMAELAQFYHRCLLQTKEAELARDYLKTRDLGAQVQEDFLIGYAPNGIEPILRWAEKHGYTLEELSDAGIVKLATQPTDRPYHRFGGRLMFTIRDRQARVVAFSGRQLVASKMSGKYVNSPETIIFKKSQVLFGFDKAQGNIARSAHHEVIVCEGQIDTIRLHISGFPIAVASQGTAFTEEHAHIVSKVADSVVLVFDDDSAGHKATIKTARLFLAAKMPVRTISLPNGDDPDSYLRTHKSEDFQRLIDNSESIVSFQVRVGRAGEINPDSIDAVSRVARAVLTTIAQSTDAVLKASLLGEAAKLLHLPVSALQDELAAIPLAASKTVARPPKVAEAPTIATEEVGGILSAASGEAADEDAVEAEFAADDSSPTPLELSFCAFLLDNEYDKKLDALVGAYTPNEVFTHDLIRRVVTTWRDECATGEDLFKDFTKNLSHREKSYLSGMYSVTGYSGGSNQSVEGNFIEWACRLWAERITSLRGSLPAQGNDETQKLRVMLTVASKLTSPRNWERAKKAIPSLVDQLKKTEMQNNAPTGTKDRV